MVENERKRRGKSAPFQVKPDTLCAPLLQYANHMLIRAPHKQTPSMGHSGLEQFPISRPDESAGTAADSLLDGLIDPWTMNHCIFRINLEWKINPNPTVMM